ncbi:MAG: ACP S-malonyltransferase, partial [Gammaproteobacteria bacterium]|nr:ACP S-malonyltransferase [Gammaproteobacteria bacterium]
GEVLEAVNFNAPGQVAVAGATVAVERLLDQAKSAGAKRAVRLPVSAPVHSSLMAPAAKKMEQRLQMVDIHTPQVPVLHNFHLRSEREPEAIRKALVAQIDAPVRWVQTVRELTKAGVSTIIECGPGKVLTGLNRRIDRNVQAISLNNCVALDQALAARAS